VQSPCQQRRRVGISQCRAHHGSYKIIIVRKRDRERREGERDALEGIQVNELGKGIREKLETVLAEIEPCELGQVA